MYISELDKQNHKIIITGIFETVKEWQVDYIWTWLADPNQV